MKLAVFKSAILTSCITLALLGYSAPSHAQPNLSASAFTAVAASQASSPVCDSAECEAEMRRLIRLARNGSGDAAALVAMAFASGDGLEQSDKEAERFIRIGVRYRSAIATFLMSDWYRNGFVLEQNPAEADKLLEQAVALNHPPALYQKATQLFASDNPEDFEEAITLLELASEENLVNAMFLLGRMKQIGAGIEQDLLGAGELYRKLIIAGVDDARPYLREVTADLEASGANDQTVARFASTQNIERISVTGSAFRINSQLTGIVRRLTASGQYDSRSIGSRIRGVSCEQSGSACTVTRPGSEASSISDIIESN